MICSHDTCSDASLLDSINASFSGRLDSMGDQHYDPPRLFAFQHHEPRVRQQTTCDTRHMPGLTAQPHLGAILQYGCGWICLNSGHSFISKVVSTGGAASCFAALKHKANFQLKRGLSS